jgi:hypothetical protein
MISIEKINWLDKETAEAEVYLSGGQYKLFVLRILTDLI